MSSIPRTSGIYKIVCLSNDKVYIGSTINLQRRIIKHRYDLRHGVHANRYLQNAWKKHGELVFEFRIIELIAAPLLVEREQYWIDKLRACDHRRGYNVRPIANSNRGIKRKPSSPEHIQRRVASRRGYRHSDETRIKIGAANRGRKPSRAAKEAHFAAVSKTWRVIDPAGNEQIIIGLEGFCRENGLCAVSMANVAKGKQHQHKGWECYRVGE